MVAISFVVADFDCDGKAEMIVRTAPGTVDGTGRVLTDAGVWASPDKVEFLKPENTILVCDANFKASDKTVGDYRRGGHPLETPEFLTVFDGLTGKALDTVKYDPEPSFYFGPDLKGHGIWFRGCYIP